MGLNIELSDLRQYRRPLSYIEIDSLGKSLKAAIIAKGNLDPANVSFEQPYFGLRLIIRKLPQNEEADFIRFVTDRLYRDQYGFSIKSQSLRTLFKVSSTGTSALTAQKMSMLRDEFDAAYGGWQPRSQRFDYAVTSSTSFDLVCKQGGEDLDAVEAVIRSSARPLHIAGLKIDGPLEVV